MTEEQALAKPDAPDEYGTREEVQALALRIQHSPLGKGFTQEELWGIAQYARVMDLNPFRGEFYPMRGKDGKIHMVDGYKDMARWAKNEAAYSEVYDRLPLKDGELYKYRCRIMRDDRLPLIGKYKDMGATFQEAFNLVSTYADGCLLEKETIGRNGHPIDPPKGWTWRQVTRKRALKNALNLSHGAPSPKQIAATSYIVNGTDTTLEDWEGTEELKYPEERENLAALRAQTRENRAEWESLSADQQQAKLKENTDLLRGEEDFEGFGDEPSQAERLRQTDADWEATDAAAQDRAEIAGPPGTQEQPASQQKAVVKAGRWNKAARELVEEVGHYTLDADGAPNWNHLTAAALSLGYPEITDENLEEVIEGLEMYAEDAQAQARENEGTSLTDADLTEGTIEVGETTQEALL